MQCTARESVALAKGILHGIQGTTVLPHIVLCPSFPALADVREVILQSPVSLGAQNVAGAVAGAFTGEVSAQQLADAGCTYVLVGHSERRQLFGEDDATVRAKVAEAVAVGVTPIICVGETAEDREQGKELAVIGGQVRAALEDIVFPRKMPCIFAYEPIWAIGSNTPAAPIDVVTVHREIRRIVQEVTTMADGDIVVLYGGSVDGDNASTFLREREVDGVLVGSASVKIPEFLAIITAAGEVMSA